MKIIHVKVLKNEELAKGIEHVFCLGLVVVGLTVSRRLLCLLGKSTGWLRVDSGSDFALGLLTLKKPGFWLPSVQQLPWQGRREEDGGSQGPREGSTCQPSCHLCSHIRP